MTLHDWGEFGFIDRVRQWLGPRADLDDDAAVVELTPGSRLVASVDTLLEGVHFRWDWSSAADVGWKAVAVNLSDLAAMGARPRWLLVSVAARPDIEGTQLEELYAGLAEAAAHYGADVVGGDTTRSTQVALSVTALGEVEGEPMRRSGAKLGDVLAVTGPLGRAAAGVNILLSQDPKGLRPEDALACMDAHRRPRARVDTGHRLREAGVHAAIDLSDGLASDAHRLAEACGHGVEIDAAAVPVAPEARAVAEARDWDVGKITMYGGEDYELLVAVSEEHSEDLGLMRVGRVVDSGVWVVTDGDRAPLEPGGWDHFA